MGLHPSLCFSRVCFFFSAVCLVMESQAKAQWGWGYAMRMLRLGLRKKLSVFVLALAPLHLVRVSDGK